MNPQNRIENLPPPPLMLNLLIVNKIEKQNNVGRNQRCGLMISDKMLSAESAAHSV